MINYDLSSIKILEFLNFQRVKFSIYNINNIVISHTNNIIQTIADSSYYKNKRDL